MDGVVYSVKEGGYGARVDLCRAGEATVLQKTIHLPTRLSASVRRDQQCGVLEGLKKYFQS